MVMNQPSNSNLEILLVEYIAMLAGVHWDRIDDIAYAYRCQQLNLKQRREFLLEGVAWKKIKERPLDNLLLADLKELSLRGMVTAGQKKTSLEKAFEKIINVTGSALTRPPAIFCLSYLQDL